MSSQQHIIKLQCPQYWHYKPHMFIRNKISSFHFFNDIKASSKRDIFPVSLCHSLYTKASKAVLHSLTNNFISSDSRENTASSPHYKRLTQYFALPQRLQQTPFPHKILYNLPTSSRPHKTWNAGTFSSQTHSILMPLFWFQILLLFPQTSLA